MVNSILGVEKLGKTGIVRGPEPKNQPPPEKKEPLAQADDFVVFARLVDGGTRKPLGGAKYEILDEQGKGIAQGETDWQATINQPVPTAGPYQIKVKIDAL